MFNGQGVLDALHQHFKAINNNRAEVNSQAIQYLIGLNNTMNFLKIDYLKDGNERQKSAYNTLVDYQIIEILADYNPILTGTIPINIDIDTSDLDIVCYWRDSENFATKITEYFDRQQNFKLGKALINGHQSIIANFKIEGFDIEIFGQNIPTENQTAYRHMLIEHQILKDRGNEFRLKIIELKEEGYKTEPAFAKLLGLKGDPYLALLELSLS